MITADTLDMGFGHRKDGSDTQQKCSFLDFLKHEDSESRESYWVVMMKILLLRKPSNPMGEYLNDIQNLKAKNPGDIG